MMNFKYYLLLALIVFSCVNDVTWAQQLVAGKKTVHALYLPLADHYAALIAYDRYRDKMKKADFVIEKMQSWDQLRALFNSGGADMAFIMSPLAMDMFLKKPEFRWIGLMHRDGNGFVLNEHLAKNLSNDHDHSLISLDQNPIQFIKQHFARTGKPVVIAVPHLLSTHAVALIKYFNEYDIQPAMHPNDKSPVLLIAVPPAESTAFLRKNDNRSEFAGFDQSVPWTNIAYEQGEGHLIWYSKEIIESQSGHVECIVVATDKAIKEKEQALREVMAFIQQAGRDIEIARKEGGQELENIVSIIQKYIPGHSYSAIVSGLSLQKDVINYRQLGIDKNGLNQIMQLALATGVLKKSIDIDAFADEKFSVVGDGSYD